MKNILVLGVTVALLYLGYDAMQPAPLPPPPAPVAARPAPTVAPKVYFHSALDAPAMATNMSTGTSYFSTDPNSRFNAGYVYGTSGSRLDGGTTYNLVVPSGGAATASANTGRPASAVETYRSQRTTYLRQDAPRPTPGATVTAR